MKIVAGLGNPGAQYANTPHSVGFETVDALAASLGATWEAKPRFRCEMAKCEIAGEKAILVKPMTFMNLSGEAVAPVVGYHNATAADLVVVQDDIDLPLGRIRIRKGGSCGGHNGVRSVIERLGTPGFARVKLGVGKDREDVVGFVLGKFDPASRKVMDSVVAEAAKAVVAVISQGCERAMNAYNGWRAPDGGAE